MEDVVLASTPKFLFVHVGLSCLALFQSMLTKIMFALAVLCSSGPVPCTVAADDAETDHADDIALLKQLLEPITGVVKTMRDIQESCCSLA